MYRKWHRLNIGEIELTNFIGQLICRVMERTIKGNARVLSWLHAGKMKS